jgi:hypothetical protein
MLPRRRGVVERDGKIKGPSLALLSRQDVLGNVALKGLPKFRVRKVNVGKK